MQSVKTIIMGVVLLALSPFLVHAQLLDPVSYSVKEIPEQVKAGDVFTVVVEAVIDGEWHLYSAHNDPDAGPYPTTFSSVSDGWYIAGDIEETEPKIVLDPNFNEKLGWHSVNAEFKIPVAFTKEVEGNHKLTLEVLYQVCDDKSCLPPTTKQIEADVQVAGIAENFYQPPVNNSLMSSLVIIAAVGVSLLFLGFIFYRRKFKAQK